MKLFLEIVILFFLENSLIQRTRLINFWEFISKTDYFLQQILGIFNYIFV